MNTYTQQQIQVCETPILERPRYFRGQVMTPLEMTLEQDYFINKMRLHNRLLHGWGVVCGAQVCPVEKSNKKGYELWKVSVSSGYILGPYGDDILINAERVLDLRTGGLVSRSDERGGELSDPWCSTVHNERLPEEVFLAVKYKEISARPVSIMPGCGCNDQSCENSRLCDGYEIGLLTHCPKSHDNPPDLKDPALYRLDTCPPCPDDPWVVLARIRLNRRGDILEIDNCSCRRMVISLANAWQRCAEPPIRIDVAEPMTQYEPQPEEVESEQINEQSQADKPARRRKSKS